MIHCLHFFILYYNINYFIIMYRYLVCENQKNVAVHCPSTAWVISMEIKNGNGIITTRVPHNHLPPNVDISMVHLRRSIGVAGTSTGNLATSIRQIYNREVVL
uniref:Uncharacterized protein n=1 Tax=Schizaphis graminum TaxID=13262 RepID=A0A2S2PD20_SCHGA